MSLLSGTRSSLRLSLSLSLRRDIKDSQVDPVLFASRRSLEMQKLRLCDVRENSTGNIRTVEEFLSIAAVAYKDVCGPIINKNTLNRSYLLSFIIRLQFHRHNSSPVAIKHRQTSGAVVKSAMAQTALLGSYKKTEC